MTFSSSIKIVSVATIKAIMTTIFKPTLKTIMTSSATTTPHFDLYPSGITPRISHRRRDHPSLSCESSLHEHSCLHTSISRVRLGRLGVLNVYNLMFVISDWNIDFRSGLSRSEYIGKKDHQSVSTIRISSHARVFIFSVVVTKL